MLIFALNFFGSNSIRLLCLKKGKKTHEYTSCQVRGFLIIPQTYVKGARSYFLFHYTKDVNLKFRLKWSSYFNVQSKICILQLPIIGPILYCVSAIMVTITRHISINLPNGILFSCEISQGL